MKSKYHRLIKILSCSLTIAAVVLCSVCVPANAAVTWTVLKPADHIADIYYSGNYRYVRYDFGIEPYLTFTASSGYHTNYGYISISPLSSDQSYDIKVFPLGVNLTQGPPLNASSVVFPSSDFVPTACIDVFGDFQIDLELGGFSTDVQVDKHFVLTTTTYFLGYDANGRYLRTVAKNQVSKNQIIQDNPDGSAIRLKYPLDTVLDLSVFGTDVKYISTYYQINIAYTDANEDDITINYVRCFPGDFAMVVRTDMLLQESLTLQAIEDQMGELNDQVGDLNDKADTIISGSDDMQDAADGFSGSAGNAQQDMDAAIDELEKLPEADFDDVDMTFEGLLNDQGFNQYANFFEFLVLDTLYVKMMVIVCTFIWVSTLLYGKRG